MAHKPEIVGKFLVRVVLMGVVWRAMIIAPET